MPRVEPQASPRISTISWGRMEVEGLAEAKDFKLWPGGGRPWDWNETGTRHDPGIQPADVEELLEHESRVVVLSRGQELQLQTTQDTLNVLRIWPFPRPWPPSPSFSLGAAPLSARLQRLRQYPRDLRDPPLSRPRAHRPVAPSRCSPR